MSSCAKTVHYVQRKTNLFANIIGATTAWNSLWMCYSAFVFQGLCDESDLCLFHRLGLNKATLSRNVDVLVMINASGLIPRQNERETKEPADTGCSSMTTWLISQEFRMLLFIHGLHREADAAALICHITETRSLRRPYFSWTPTWQEGDNE